MTSNIEGWLSENSCGDIFIEENVLDKTKGLCSKMSELAGTRKTIEQKKKRALEDALEISKMVRRGETGKTISKRRASK